MSKPDPRSETDKAARPLGGPTGKTCAKCGQEKTWLLDSNQKHGARTGCSPCLQKYKTSWRASNPDKERGYGRKAYRANPQKAADKNRAYRKANPEYFRKATQKYNAQKYGAILPGLRFDQYGKHEGKDCYVCGDPAQATDHVHPLNKGGIHCNINFKPICQPCNSSKLDRTYPGHSSWETFLSSRRA